MIATMNHKEKHEEKFKQEKSSGVDHLAEFLSKDKGGDGGSDPFGVSLGDDDGILSLIGAGRENSMQMEHALLPELNEIIEVPFEESGDSGDELQQFVELPTENEKEVEFTKELVAEPPGGRSFEEDSLMKIFAAKLGVDIEDMTQKEREAFVVDAATMLTITFESLCGSVRGIRKLKKDMGMLPTMDEIDKNPILDSKSTKEIFEHSRGEHLALSGHIKSLFDEIDMHNIAFFEAVVRERRETMREFSPKDLYKTFEQDKKLSGLFRSKKSLAWDAYVEKFSDLDNIKDNIGMEDLAKEYRRVAKSLKIGFSK